MKLVGGSCTDLWYDKSVIKEIERHETSVTIARDLNLRASVTHSTPDRDGRSTSRRRSRESQRWVAKGVPGHRNDKCKWRLVLFVFAT